MERKPSWGGLLYTDVWLLPSQPKGPSRDCTPRQYHRNLFPEALVWPYSLVSGQYCKTCHLCLKQIGLGTAGSVTAGTGTAGLVTAGTGTAGLVAAGWGLQARRLQAAGTMTLWSRGTQTSQPIPEPQERGCVRHRPPYQYAIPVSGRIMVRTITRQRTFIKVMAAWWQMWTGTGQVIRVTVDWDDEWGTLQVLTK